MSRRRWAILFGSFLIAVVTFVLVSGHFYESQSTRQARRLIRNVTWKLQGSLPHLSWSKIGLGIRDTVVRYWNHQVAKQNPFEDSLSAARAGAEIFRSHCSSCHGLTGRDGEVNLAEDEFRHGGGDAALFETVLNGIGGKMPGAALSRAQIWQALAFIQTLREGLAFPHTEMERSSVEIPYERLVRAQEEPEDWLMYSGAYSSHRYSLLEQVSRDNVAALGLRWVYPIESSDQVQTTPLVVGGVMYLTLPPDQVVALDTTTGRPIWVHRRKLVEPWTNCCGPMNRGLAILNEKLYKGTPDAHLIALDAATGRLIWDVEVADNFDGYGITGAPLAVKDRIIIGVNGGELGIRGFLDAYDAETGKRIWRFYTVPGPGERGHETWAKGSWKTGGAPTWLTGSFDPALNLVYWGTGNPGPTYDGEVRKGDNLYANCVIALDADTGALRWWFQFSPHDVYDWDSTQIPVLGDMDFQGRQRKLMLWANRNAFFYVLDRETGEFLLARQFARQTWTDGIDTNGRPIRRPDARPSAGGTLVYPGPLGATNWYSPSYSPKARLFYFVAWDDYASYYFSGGGLFGPGAPYIGKNPKMASVAPGTAFIRALVPHTGEKKWERELPGRSKAGLLSTAASLVFGGSELGLFFALDGNTGEELWRTNLGTQITAAPVIYLSGGKQQIAIASQSGIYAFQLPD